MNSVVMLWAWARLMIDCTLPPEDFGSCQIHMPLPSNGLGPGSPIDVSDGGVGTTGCLTTSGPTALERWPRLSLTWIRPVPALSGTVTTRPVADSRSGALAVPRPDFGREDDGQPAGEAVALERDDAADLDHAAGPGTSSCSAA